MESLLLTKQSLPPSPCHCLLHSFETHSRETRAPTISIALIPAQCFPKMRRGQRSLVALLQALLQTRVFLNLLPQRVRAIHLIQIHARRRDVLICRPIPLVLDVCTGSLERLHEDSWGQGAVGEMSGGDGPFIANGEGAVDEVANEGFGIGCHGDDDGLGDGLRESLVDEFADGFPLKADAAVGCVAVNLEGRHVFHEHSVV
jgi:hypothetical protein